MKKPVSPLVEISHSALRVAVFTSGSGGLLGHLLKNMQSETFSVDVVVADRDCRALQVAGAKKIPTLVLKDPDKASSYLEPFSKFQLDALVFAGYLTTVPTEVCNVLHGRAINSHPSLLPKFGGRGFYGLRVHEAVIKSGDTQTGCTVHLVSPEVDGGQIVAQRNLEVYSGETPPELARRIHEIEKELLLEVLVKWPRRA